MTRALRFAAWLLAFLLLAEGAVRAVGLLIGRDQGIAPGRPGARVVYCLGDSFTYGQGVAPGEAWPRLLEARLRTVSADPPEVRTLAEPGRSSSVVIETLAEVLRAGDARLVLILTGWNANDGDFAAHAVERREVVPWTTTLDLWLLHSRLYKVVKHALTLRSRTLVLEDVKVVPQTTAMSLYKFRAYQEIAQKNLRQLARMCHAASAPCAFLTYPHRELPPNPYTRTEYYHMLFGRTALAEDDYLVHDRRPGEIAIDAIIRTVGEEEGVPVIDLQPAFAAAGRTDLFQADLHHPTAPGHVLMADAIVEAARPVLAGGR
jgi:lysophospholipase L1-like esterase